MNRESVAAASRIAGFALISAAGAVSILRIVLIWRAFAKSMPNLPYYTSYTSVWTFMWPATVGVIGAVIAAAAMLRDRRSLSPTRLMLEIVSVLTTLYFFWLVARTIWRVYDPSHTGPAL